MTASTILKARNEMNNPENTRFWPYLQDNDLPPLSLLNDLKRNLRRPQRELEDMDRSINVLSITLNALIRARHSMYQAIAVYHPILAPIRRLPDDVLAEIFVHCLPSDRKVAPFHLDAPLVFGLVCRKWRAISLATPQLWSTLHITMPWSDSGILPVTSPQGVLRNATVGNASDLWSFRARALKEWIGRSGIHPLSLSIYIIHETGASIHGSIANFKPINLDLLSFIASQSYRWSDIEFSVPPHLANNLFVNADKHSCPKLCSFGMRIALPPGVFMLKPPTQKTAWLSGDSLRSISISQPLSMGPPQYIDTIQWSLIIQLSLDIYAPYQTFLTILAQCPNLEYCLLRLTRMIENIQPVDSFDEGPSTRNSMVVLPKLHTLLLMSSHQGQWVVGFEDFYNRLDTPNLVKLLLFSLLSAFSTPTTVNPDTQVHALEGYLKRCVSLTKFTLDIRGLDQHQLFWILRAASSVTELTFDTQERMAHNKRTTFPPIPHFVLKALLIEPGSSSEAQGVIVPELGVFKVYGLTYNAAQDLNMLRDMLKSRIRQGACTCLEYVEVMFHSASSQTLPMDIATELEQHARLVGRKVVFNITYPSQKGPTTSNSQGQKQRMDWRSNHMWRPTDISTYLD